MSFLMDAGRAEEATPVSSAFNNAGQQVHPLASVLTMAEQHERHRISQVLHDDLQQRLFAIRMQLSMLEETHDTGDPQRFAAELDEIQQQIGDAIELTRSLSIELSPVILEDERLEEAIISLARQMKEKFGLQVDIQVKGSPARLDASSRLLLYEAAREMLFNVVKHSKTLKARVKLDQSEEYLRIAISDRGIGFDLNSLSASTSTRYGLLNTRNKIMMMGGTMIIESSPGQGMRLLIKIPARPAEDSP